MGDKKSNYRKQKQQEEIATDDASSDLTPPPAEDILLLTDDDLELDDTGSAATASLEPKSKASKQCNKNKKDDIKDNESIDSKKRTIRSMFFVIESHYTWTDVCYQKLFFRFLM